MKLKNFSIPDEAYAIEVNAFDHLWDLHNVADFEGFRSDLTRDTLELKWQINPDYAFQKYPANAFAILFRDLDFLEISPRDPRIPKSEDTCLSSVCRVLPEEKMPRNASPPDGPFHLLFKFQSGFGVRVGAESAEFLLCH